VLLTRAPLYSRSCPRFLVRLACVRHAASVDSEPGSNSRLKLGSIAQLHLSAPLHDAKYLELSLSLQRQNGEIDCLFPCREKKQFAQLCARSEARGLWLRALTWHAQLNCQRSIISSFGTSSPRPGNLRERFTLLATTRPARTTPHRTIAKITKARIACQGPVSRNLKCYPLWIRATS
jgi:hypothetical protein